MRPRVGVVMRALLCASVLSIAATSLAYAGDPAGTGIAGAGPAYVPPPGVLAQKEADLAAFLRGSAPTRPVKRGAAATSIAAMAVSPAYATSYYLTYFPGFHQKRAYYCLVAVVQSVAYFDISEQKYYLLGTNGVLPAQDLIYNGYKDPDTGVYYQGIKATDSRDLPGSYDSLAIAWLNAQYKAANISFTYVGGWPNSQTDFLNYVHLDVSGYAEGTYARVDLSKSSGTGYMWYQAPNTHGDIDHATMAVGYNDSAGSIRSYDPYASPSGSSCTAPSSTGNAYGCNWTITTARYYTALDFNIDRGQNGPIWW